MLIFHLSWICAESVSPSSTKSSNAWRHSSLTEAGWRFLNFSTVDENNFSKFDETMLLFFGAVDDYSKEWKTKINLAYTSLGNYLVEQKFWVLQQMDHINWFLFDYIINSKRSWFRYSLYSKKYCSFLF